MHKPDTVFSVIADYVLDAKIDSPEAYETARLCLMDSLGCAMLALRYPECTRLLGPVVPGTVVPQGSRVPGTHFVLDPVEGAFQIGMLIRWLDFNDTWLAAEWGHPSDNLGGLLAVTDFFSRQPGGRPFTIRDLLTAMIQAHEIQGILALENSFNRVGLDHVILVRVATAAVAVRLMGGKREEIINAVSNAWVDGGNLRVYRHAPNTGSRKSWAAGDATSRGIRLALMAMKGEMGYPHALSAKTWGFYDVFFKSKAFVLSRPFGSHVMENVLFKVSYPAEFHAQTAVECAVQLHAKIKNRLEQIDQITITTHESAIRIINKQGPLKNPADRDHCLQYIVAIGLIFGDLTADHYEGTIAADPRIDAIRQKMVVVEDPQYSKDYLDPDKRLIANAVQIRFEDGTMTDKVVVQAPIGHRRRRKEAIPLLIEKFKKNLSQVFSSDQIHAFLDLFSDAKRLDRMPVNEWMDGFKLPH